jgi:predicted nucleic acid-binding protein
MSPSELSPGLSRGVGLLVDTNLLVLLVVGTVNRQRIETFKRTRQYTEADYDLLLRVLQAFPELYTLAHVMAEVSNLTDLTGAERLRARHFLKETISLMHEMEISSARAAEDRLYERLGLADAAISAAARAQNLAVLTDDLDLYVQLSRDNLSVINFTHLRERAWGL